MSDYGDFCRERRASKHKAQMTNSHLCFTCGTRVWNSDKQCRTCHEPNNAYRKPTPGQQGRIEKNVKWLLGGYDE